jgi:hypothetical protein
MRTYLAAPVSLGALLVGWAVGWSIGFVVILAAVCALSFGVAFWWCWDAWQERRRQRATSLPSGRA